MISNRETIEVNWTGPYSWPKFETESDLPSIPKHSGVYLQTIEYKEGYLIYAAGLTRRPIPTRFREHTRKYISGDYTVLDIVAMQHGVRKEVWHGWGWTPEKRTKFEQQRPTISVAVRRQLAGFRIFVANIGTQPRLLERLEASIMLNLYQQTPPFCDIPDTGMMLTPKWDSERSIFVTNRCTVLLYGLPSKLKI